MNSLLKQVRRYTDLITGEEHQSMLASNMELMTAEDFKMIYEYYLIQEQRLKLLQNYCYEIDCKSLLLKKDWKKIK